MRTTTCVLQCSGLRAEPARPRFQPETQTWRARVGILNTGYEAVFGPLALTIDQLRPGTTLLNATGRYRGCPCVQVDLPNNMLLPHGRAEVLLEFSRQGLWKWLGLRYVLRVYPAQQSRPLLSHPILAYQVNV